MSVAWCEAQHAFMCYHLSREVCLWDLFTSSMVMESRFHEKACTSIKPDYWRLLLGGAHDSVPRQGFATTGEARFHVAAAVSDQISIYIYNSRRCEDSAVILYDLAQEQAHFSLYSLYSLRYRRLLRCASASFRLHVPAAVESGPCSGLETARNMPFRGAQHLLGPGR